MLLSVLHPLYSRLCRTDVGTETIWKPRPSSKQVDFKVPQRNEENRKEHTHLFDMKCFRNSKAKACLLSLLLLLLLNDIIELRINVCYRLDEAISFGEKNGDKQKEISGKEK